MDGWKPTEARHRKGTAEGLCPAGHISNLEFATEELVDKTSPVVIPSEARDLQSFAIAAKLQIPPRYARRNDKALRFFDKHVDHVQAESDSTTYWNWARLCQTNSLLS
jgi:hypothetical protein